MAYKGCTVCHAGRLGQKSADLVSYFEAVRGVRPIPESLNPATWMLEVTTPGNEARLGMDFADSYAKSGLFK